MLAAHVSRQQAVLQVPQQPRAALHTAHRLLTARAASCGGSTPAHASQRNPLGATGAAQSRQSLRCEAQRDTDRSADQQWAPNAPPICVPSQAPPPPPPPPRYSQSVLGPFGRRGALLAIMFGGAALVSSVVRRDDPSVVTMKEGVTIATTPGGNPVAVFTDENGNIFLIDPNGNLYYDTGDPQIGFYFVDQEGTMLNIFVDGAGQPQYVPVGNISDLGSIDATALGGVPIEDLEKAHEKQVARLWVFPSETDASLPDNAPAVIAKDGTVQPPPVLEEGALLLQEKKRWWPFGSPSEGGGNFKRG